MMDDLFSLEINDVRVHYGAIKALDSVNARLAPHDWTGLIGPNGAGKTTLLNVISGFARATSGSILLGDQDISHLNVRRRVKLGIVRGFQTARLLERESVLVNILVGRERFRRLGPIRQLLGTPAYREAERTDRAAVERIMEMLGIEEIRDLPVNTLPFGSRRLVEIARVLVSRPHVVLLDEPAAGLDQASRTELTATLATVHEQEDATVVIVEHDVELVQRLCPSTLVLDAGWVIAAGATNSVLQSPVVREALLGGVHIVEG